MIAMQYSIVLPADYDMNIIQQRIGSKGHALDNFPGLIFKAYLTASKGTGAVASQENLYAPFYLWEDNGAMNRFLAGDMFTGLAQAFGWPSVKTWSVWSSHLSRDLANARYATRETAGIAPHSSLRAMRESESTNVQSLHANRGALAAVSAFEPTTWTLVRLNLWASPKREPLQNGVQAYDVGHISMATPEEDK